MSLEIDDLGESKARGTASQIAVTLFVGIPATIALVAALAAYCTFHYVTFAFFPRRQSIDKSLVPPDAEGKKR